MQSLSSSEGAKNGFPFQKTGVIMGVVMVVALVVVVNNSGQDTGVDVSERNAIISAEGADYKTKCENTCSAMLPPEDHKNCIQDCPATKPANCQQNCMNDCGRDVMKADPKATKPAWCSAFCSRLCAETVMDENEKQLWHARQCKGMLQRMTMGDYLLHIKSDGWLKRVNRNGESEKVPFWKVLADEGAGAFWRRNPSLRWKHKSYVVGKNGEHTVVVFSDNSAVLVENDGCSVVGLYGPTSDGSVDDDIEKKVSGIEVVADCTANNEPCAFFGFTSCCDSRYECRWDTGGRMCAYRG